MKPAYSTAHGIRTYFASLNIPVLPGELLVVGDRIFTDVVLAHRLGHRPTIARRISARLRSFARTGVQGGEDTLESRPLAVWTTGVWKRESMVMRRAERAFVDVVERFVPNTQKRRLSLEGKFVKPPAAVVEEAQERGRGQWLIDGAQWLTRRIGFRASRS